MRRALTRAAGLTLLVFALAVSERARAEGSRPVVRVVLVAGGETPVWFDGFVKHLESELGLRGIEVAVTRGASAALGQGEGLAPRADAELVVDAPSALRPMLRFSVAPAEGSAVNNTSGRVRQVDLARVPSDGWALALAASADELMRSNWPRAVPPAAAATAEAQASPAPAEKARAESSPGIEARPAAEVDRGVVPADPAPTADSLRSAEGASRFSVGAAGAGEAFGGGQLQLGPDLRVAVRALPRLELGVRAGWRRLAPRETTHGAIDGSAFIAGGGLHVLVLAGGRATLWLGGRADLLRVGYRGQPRDSSIVGDTGSAVGLVVSAGPLGRVAVTRTVNLDAELSAGASPITTTATDAWQSAVSTNGAAIMASLGLSLGL